MNKFAPLLLISGLAAAGALACFAVHPDDQAASRVERGKYIVTSFGCADCHTPLKLGPNGPERDLAMNFAGHPASLELPPAPTLPPGPWNVSAAGTMTAWSGPWGTSFTANLTPDDETGIGKWSEAQFLETVRSGRHLGRGRAILPPMPIEPLANLNDSDLGAVYAYLHSLPPISNRVPQPIPPAE
ncbi:MAG: diheme cytochrome c-553 [Planctomycetes bacterium]|nr:diheme cytochrome c-553 [Planctomycetota bacterium]